MAQIIQGGATGPIGVEAHQRTNVGLANMAQTLQNLGGQLDDRRNKKSDDYYTSVIAPLIAGSGGPQMASKVNPGAFMKWFDMSGQSADNAIDMTAQLSSGQLTVPELLAKSGMEWSLGNVAPYDDDIQAIVDQSKLSGDPSGLDRAYEMAQTRFKETQDPVYNQQMTGIEAQQTAMSGEKIPLGTPVIDDYYQDKINSRGITQWAPQTPGTPSFQTNPAVGPGSNLWAGAPTPTAPAGISTPEQSYQAPYPALDPNTYNQYVDPRVIAAAQNRSITPRMNVAPFNAAGASPQDIPGMSSVPGMGPYDAATGGQDAHRVTVTGDGEGVVNYVAMQQPGVKEAIDQLNAQFPNPAAPLAPESLPVDALNQGAPVMAEGSSPQGQGGGTTAPPDPMKEEETRINHIIKLQEMAGKTQDPQVQQMIMGNLTKLGWSPPPPPTPQPPSPQQMAVQAWGRSNVQSGMGRPLPGHIPGQGQVMAGGRVPVLADPTGRTAGGDYPVSSTPPPNVGYGMMTIQPTRAEDGYSQGPPAGTPLTAEDWVNAVKTKQVEMTDVPEGLYEKVLRGLQISTAEEGASTPDPTLDKLGSNFPGVSAATSGGLDANAVPTDSIRQITKNVDGSRGLYGSELDALRSRYSAAGLTMDPDEGVPADATPQDMAYYNAINQVFNKGLSGQGASDQVHRRQNATGYDVDIVPTEEGNRFSTMEEWNPAWGTPVEEFNRNGVSLLEYRPGEQAPEETTTTTTTTGGGGETTTGGGKKPPAPPENTNPVRAGRARRYIAAHKNDWRGQNDSQQVQNFMNMAFPEGNATLMDFLNDPATAMDSRTKKATLEESARQFDQRLQHDKDLLSYKKLVDSLDAGKVESWFEANPELADEMLYVQKETQRLREKILAENPKLNMASPELDDLLGAALAESGLLDRVNTMNELYANVYNIPNMTGFIQSYDDPGFAVKMYNWLGAPFNKDARDKANEAWRLDHPDGYESRTVPTGTNYLSAAEEAAQVSAGIAAKYNQ